MGAICVQALACSCGFRHSLDSPPLPHLALIGMPILARLDWIERQLAEGRHAFFTIGSAMDKSKIKIKVVLKPLANDGTDGPCGDLRHTLDFIRNLALNGVAMDRGHRHSDGTAVVNIWIQAGGHMPASVRDVPVVAPPAAPMLRSPAQTPGAAAAAAANAAMPKESLIAELSPQTAVAQAAPAEASENLEVSWKYEGTAQAVAQGAPEEASNELEVSWEYEGAAHSLQMLTTTTVVEAIDSCTDVRTNMDTSQSVFPPTVSSPPSTLEDMIWNVHYTLTASRGVRSDLFADAYRAYLGHTCMLERFLVVDESGYCGALRRIPHVVTITSLDNGVLFLRPTQDSKLTREELLTVDLEYRALLARRRDITATEV